MLILYSPMRDIERPSKPIVSSYPSYTCLQVSCETDDAGLSIYFWWWMHHLNSMGQEVLKMFSFFCPILWCEWTLEVTRLITPRDKNKGCIDGCVHFFRHTCILLSQSSMILSVSGLCSWAA